MNTRISDVPPGQMASAAYMRLPIASRPEPTKETPSPSCPDNVAALLVRPRQACSMLNCGLTDLYKKLNAGELQSFKDGKSRKITVASIRAYVERKVGESR
jgi:excisionase family DNA binding protein